MLLDGREIADFIKQRHYQQSEELAFTPHLAIVGDDSPYVRAKQHYGEDIGLEVARHPFSERVITELNRDSGVTGIIVQLPLPPGVDTEETLDQIAAAKDVDGLRHDSRFEPATPKGIIWLLASYGVEIRSRRAAVVGQGRLVGAPLSEMLENSGADVVPCDIDTPNLLAQTRRADIVVSATGQKHLIQPGMVKRGAVLIDCGSPDPEIDPLLLEDESLRISPVPGGVGPMTVAALFDNLLIAAQRER